MIVLRCHCLVEVLKEIGKRVDFGMFNLVYLGIFVNVALVCK